MPSWLQNLLLDHEGQAGVNPLLSAPAPAPAPESALAPAPDSNGSAWKKIGRGDRYEEEVGQPYGVSYTIAPTDYHPDAGAGNAMFRVNLHRSSLEDLDDSFDPQHDLEHFGHVGSMAMSPEDRGHDTAKAHAALEAAARKFQRMLKNKELPLQQKIRRNDEIVPTKDSMFVRIERGSDAPYHRISQSDHDKARLNYATHRENQSEAVGKRNEFYKNGYIASIVPPEMMQKTGSEGARLRSIEEHKHRTRTGKDFPDWMRKNQPEVEHEYQSAMALSDIRKKIGDAKGWHKVPM